MKRALTLAAILASISACATGGTEARREAAATASPATGRPEGEAATGREAVATSGEGRSSRADERRARAMPTADEHRGVARDERRARGAYTVDGRVADVGGVLHKSVRIEREGKDPAELRIADDTRVLLDGQAARLDDVHEGDEVRATFELRGETPTATELRVRPGSGAK